jgi:hypothetical protein
MPSNFGEYVFNVGWICKDSFIIIIYYFIIIIKNYYTSKALIGEGHIWCIHMEDVAFRIH